MHLIFNVVYQTFQNKMETITAVKIDVLRQYTSTKTEINDLGIEEFECHGKGILEYKGNKIIFKNTFVMGDISTSMMNYFRAVTSF
jgi:hypothetical protein